jgi:hypothetical protein
MQIAKPLVHLKKENATSLYHIHVVTWMDQTRFKSDGFESFSTSSVDGVYGITLNITEDLDVPDMHLLTPIVHTLTLTGISLSAAAPFIEVTVKNTTDDSAIVKTKTHLDDADDSGMPSPKLKNRM